MTERNKNDGRPDPDALLAEVKQDERRSARGKLKVFFGAAPGVGKTFAMLEEGRARAAEGLDVVVGYAEPHARSDTEALLLGMELLPYKIIEYRNVRLKEFDLDAAIKRRPAILLVDELAHTNAPGMRHPKRFQDVMEVLDAGIDVYTTLNVQHLESVNDIVERITGIKVRETLPDSVLEDADQVELVDISPDELLERIGEGKVYQGEVAERAQQNFFSKGNLMALRELALRRTAERVDAQMEDFRRENRVRDLWPTSERLLVCISSSPLSARLIRSAKRLATGLRAPWIAAYVETPRTSQADRDRAVQTLRLAQQLGAETVTLSGQHVSDEILSYSRERNVTRIIIGKPERPRWREVLLGSVVDDIIRGSGPIDIYVIRGESGRAVVPEGRRLAPQVEWMAYGWATAAVALCTGVTFLVSGVAHSEVDRANLVMAYLLVVLVIAARFGRGPGIAASVMGVAAFDFFFVPPRYTFAVSDLRYLLTFGVMLTVAVVISTLTDRVRQQAHSSRRRERRTAALLALSRELAAIRELSGLIQVTERQISEVFDARTAILMLDMNRRLAASAALGAGFPIDDKELSVAQWVFDHEQSAGLGTTTLPAARALYLPLIGSQGVVGVLGVCPASSQAFHDPDQLRLLEAFANQAAVAIERARLAEDARAAWERVEAEFMRNTLLSSVSHDLRTPLAAITGAATTLLDSNGQVTGTAQRELVETINDQAERMERLINNLLDMTRLESGGLHPRKEWQPVQEVIGSALHHLDKRLSGRLVTTHVPADLPLVPFDAISIEQVLVNLLDNALEYTPEGTPLDVNVTRTQDGIALEVLDRGPGLPPGTEQRVFEKFFRAHPGNDGKSRGIGLGLAISRGIIEAHHGKITAANRQGGGASFRFTLPIEGTPPVMDALN